MQEDEDVGMVRGARGVVVCRGRGGSTVTTGFNREKGIGCQSVWHYRPGWEDRDVKTPYLPTHHSYHPSCKLREARDLKSSVYTLSKEVIFIAFRGKVCSVKIDRGYKRKSPPYG